MNDIKRKCNPIVKFSKFTSNKKILSKVVAKFFPLFIRSHVVQEKQKRNCGSFS